MRMHSVAILLGVAACGSTQPPRTRQHVVIARAPVTEEVEASPVVDLHVGRESQVSLEMDAPLERINGHVKRGVSGTLRLDLSDTRRTHGRVRVDLQELVLTRQPRSASTGRLEAEPEVNDKQNEHMRLWLEISEDAPEQAREKNRQAEFEIERLDQVSLPRLDPAAKPSSITAIAIGRFRLRGLERTKQVPISASFDWKDGRLAAVTVTTLQPLAVDLLEHDVQPRQGFGRLAAKTLEALASKVAPIASIEIELVLAPASREP
jgi:hypothetical protein